MTEPGSSPKGTGVAMRRRFPEPPAVLFEAFTEPGLLRQWWCPYGFRTESIDFPAETGRRYRVVLRDAEGTRWVHEGVFLVVDPPRRLVYTWQWTAGPLSRVETLVELSFDPDGTGTRVSVSHTKFESAGESSAHGAGWTDAFERLTDWLAENGHR